MEWGWCRVVAVCAVALGACGDDARTDPLVDGGSDAAELDAGPTLPEIAAPDIPWWNGETGAIEPPYQMLVCSRGYRPVTDDGVTACEPWPESGRLDCPFGEVHLPGTTGCEAIGSPCPAAGTFPDALPTDRPVIYVDAAAPAGGTGSRDAPYQTIARALLSAPLDAVVAVAKGTYDETLSITNGVVLRGACAAETILAPTTSTGTPTAVSIFGAGGIADLGIRPNGDGVQLISGVGSLEGVFIEGATGSGIISAGEQLSLQRVAVVGTRPDVVGGSRGILAGGGTLIAGDTLVADSRAVGIVVRGASALLDNVTIVDTHPVTSGDLAIGLVVDPGSMVWGDHLVVEGVVGRAAQAAGPDTTVTLSDTILRDTMVGSGRYDSAGLVAGDGAVVDLTRVTFERHERSGIEIGVGGAVVEMNGFVIRDITGARAPGVEGVGALRKPPSSTARGSSAFSSAASARARPCGTSWCATRSARRATGSAGVRSRSRSAASRRSNVSVSSEVTR